MYNIPVMIYLYIVGLKNQTDRFKSRIYAFIFRDRIFEA
jgi:hypothetical protein